VHNCYYCEVQIGSEDKKETVFLAFKFSPCSECRILSFGWFPGVWILYANVLVYSVCSIFIGGVSRKREQTECSETLAKKIQMPGNDQKEIIQQECVCFSLCVQQSWWAIKGQEADRITGACQDSLWLHCKYEQIVVCVMFCHFCKWNVGSNLTSYMLFIKAITFVCLIQHYVMKVRSLTRA